jgi:hypothetical protein
LSTNLPRMSPESVDEPSTLARAIITASACALSCRATLRIPFGHRARMSAAEMPFAVQKLRRVEGVQPWVVATCANSMISAGEFSEGNGSSFQAPCWLGPLWVESGPYCNIFRPG